MIQGTITLAKGAAAKKPAAPASKRKGGSKLAEESSGNQESVPFINKDEMKTQIRQINEELPEEILDLLTDNLYTNKSRQYLDLFIQRVKESFASKEGEASSDTTRKNEMKSTQDSIKQLHGNICIFSRAIEQLAAENETNLGKDSFSFQTDFVCTCV